MKLSWKIHIPLKLWGYLFVTSLFPAFLETHLLYLTHRLLNDQSNDVLSKLIASATGSVRCQLHVNQTLYMHYLIAVFPNWCLSQPPVWLCMPCDFCTPPVALLPAITLRVAFEIDSTLKEDNPAFLLVNELQQCHLHPHCCRALIRTGEPRCTSGHLHIV